MIGKIFSWGGDDSAAPRVDEHASNPGSDASNSVASATASAARSEAIKAASSSPRRRRSVASVDAGPSASDTAALQAKVNAAITAQLEHLHNPKQWAMLLGLPAAAARAWTGDKETWTLDNEEKEVLGETGAACAQTFMITNPKALAVTMLSAVLLTVYGPRAIATLEKIKEKKAAKEKSDAKSTPNP